MDLALEANSTLESKHKTSVFSAVYKSGKTGLQVAFDYVKDNYVAVKKYLRFSNCDFFICLLFLVLDIFLLF